MAQETHFTPGPWIWEANHHGLYGAGKENVVLDYARYEGMWLPDWTDAGKANAHLIGAAPELYEAHDENERALAFLLDELQGRIEASRLAVIAQCGARCRDAKAKARGE